jgi:predicted lipopolysaccharide heptosyltransferase III
MHINRRSVKKILVLRYRSIGDIILTGPALDALSLTFPEARIDMVVDDAFADLCRGNPNINYLILHKRDRGSMSKWEYFKMNVGFIWKIRKQKYDLIVDLHSGPRSAMLTMLSGAQYRLGYHFRFRNKLAYNIPAPLGGKGVHTIDVLLQTLLPLNVKMPEEKQLFLQCQETDTTFVEDFLSKYGISRENDFIVVMHPGARIEEKRLPAEKMGAIARWLIDELGVKVVYAGNNDDIEQISEIVKFSGRRGLIATNLSLGKLAALIGAASLFVGNDSGPTHMASALGIPIVAFFGPSDPAVWGPAGENVRVLRNIPMMECQPCDQKKCHLSGNHCMTKIKINDIKRAVLSVISPNTARRV